MVTDTDIQSGKLYYSSGELFFDGTYRRAEYAKPEGTLYTFIEGIQYYRNGKKHREGNFQKAGLLVGKEYYESGKLKFEGVFNDKEGTRLYSIDGTLIDPAGETSSGDYYGPSYPLEGRFYAEDGTLLYYGRFDVIHYGGVGYPKVRSPEGFGSLK